MTGVRGRDLRSVLESVDRKGQYKRKSESITEEGTLLRVGSPEGRREVAMVLKFVKGSQVGNPHDDYIVIGTYKYADIDAEIRAGSGQRPPILLIVAKVTGRNSYRVLDADRIDLMHRIRAVAGRDKAVGERCSDLYEIELLQCMTDRMALAYASGADGSGSSPSYEVPDDLVSPDLEIDLSGPSAIDANTVAIVEDQEDYAAVPADRSRDVPSVEVESPGSDEGVVVAGSADVAETE